MPIIILFYNDNGLEMRQIMLLQAIYSVSIVVLEIPSGYFADVLGRRLTIIIGTVLGCVGFSLYSFSAGFFGFLVAEIFLGFGQSFISGSDSAMLYDTLSEMGKEKKYIKAEGRLTAIGNFSESIAGILGGFLAQMISLRGPFYFQSMVAFIGIPAAILLVEPHRSYSMLNKGFKDILRIAKYALIDNVKLRYFIIFSALMGTSTLTMAWFVQPVFIEIGIKNKILYGILWTSLNLSAGLFSWYAYKIEKILGRLNTIFFVLIFISAAYLSLGYIVSYWAIVVLFIFYFTRGITTPVLKDHINIHTSSDVRATVLSIRSFIIRIIYIIIGPVLGWITDKNNVHFALFIGGLFFLIAGTVAVNYIIKTVFIKGKSSDRHIPI